MNMRNRLVSTLAVVTALTVAGCAGSEAPTHSEALAAVTCDAGYVAYNFTRFPTRSTAEGLSRSGDAGIGVNRQPKPNLIHIESATCNGGASWAELFSDACEGRETCAFQRTDCRGPSSSNYEGAVRVSYSCSDQPSKKTNLVCNNPLRLCVFELACEQPSPSPLELLLPKEQENIQCVPEQCNVSQRRDENMQCVSDLNRPVDYTWGWDTSRSRPERMALFIDSYNVKMMYPSVRGLRGAQFKVLDLDTRNIDYFNYAGSETAFSRIWDVDLARHRILVAESLYTVKGSLYYPVKPDTENKGLRGTVSLWVYDDYKIGSANEKAFRCLMHSIDMTKYGAGTKVPEYTNLYRIDLNETFVVPKDCREDGSMFLESQAILYRPRNWSAVDFGNQSKRIRGNLTASYDLEGRTIMLDDFTDESKKITCAPNPSDFFYNEQAKTHDRYRYYAQREIPFTYQPHASGPNVLKIDEKLGQKGIFVQEANLTSLGISAIRPKSLLYKIRTVGPPRGFLRVDVDWYLSGDRHNYWVNTGTKEYPITLQTWLVPLDANDNPQPESTHLDLGEARVFKANAYGETQSAKYAITEELRNRFMMPGGTFEATKEGRKFKFRTCLKVGDGSLDFLEPPQYTLEINAPDKCRYTDAPFLIRADPSIAPLEPLTDDDLAESNPNSTGDGRMSQKLENDQDRSCERTDGGAEVCRTSGASDGEGEGSFGGSVLATDNSGYAGDGKAHVNREAELAGFEVIDDEEESPLETPDLKIAFNISPDWDFIADKLDVTIPGPNFEDETYSGGVNGLSISAEFTVPVRYGVLQGDIIYGISMGVGLAVVFEYTLKPPRPAGCTGQDEECDTIYSLMQPGTMHDVAAACYRGGGRLADLRTEAESGLLRDKISAGTKVWLGGQVADEYANPLCRVLWWPDCMKAHVSTMRWLADDEDFATSTGLGTYALDSAHIFKPTGMTALSIGTPPPGRPGNRAVTLSDTGLLEARSMSEQYAAVCKLRNSATVTSHEAKAALEIVGAAGFSLAFCTPGAEFGVCIEGSFNILETKLIPSVTYTHHDFKDKAGRKGAQSDIKLSLDFEAHILSGAIELKVVLGPWFSFVYNLFAFKGIELPIGGNITEKEFPQKEDFK